MTSGTGRQELFCECAGKLDGRHTALQLDDGLSGRFGVIILDNSIAFAAQESPTEGVVPFRSPSDRC